MDESRIEEGIYGQDEALKGQNDLNIPNVSNTQNLKAEGSPNIPGSSIVAGHDRLGPFLRPILEQLLEALNSIIRKDQSQINAQAASEEAAVLGSIDADEGSQSKFATNHLPDYLGNNPDAVVAIEQAFLRQPASSTGFHHQIRPCLNVHENSDGVDPCLRFGACNHGPRKRVRVMANSEMEAEKDIRRTARKKWMGKGIPGYLLDSWKPLWQHEGDEEYGLFQWSCEDLRRQELQLDLVDAMTSGRPDYDVHRFMRKDFRSIACWISLIGLRLHDRYRVLRPANTSIISESINPISPLTQIEILIECLWACNTCKETQVGKVLEICYRRHILVQPDFNDEPLFVSSRVTLLIHVFAVRVSLYLFNILFKHELPSIDLDENLDELWTTKLSNLEVSMRRAVETSRFDLGNAPFFHTADINLENLQMLGNVQVRWTCHWDEHLKLEIKKYPVLYLYWFQPSLSYYLSETGICGETGELEHFERTSEIFRTWRMIFTSNTGGRESHRIYAKLAAPRWLRLLAASDFHTSLANEETEPFIVEAQPLSKFGLDRENNSTRYCLETSIHLREHQKQINKKFHNELTYPLFPHYGDRLRTIRAYMDSQRPSGFKALWVDKRDLHAYYTFWLVIMFGALSVLLAMFALATTIAQTWAQFQSLSMPKQG